VPTRMEELRTRAVWYLAQWVGTFYLWGGNDPSGFDCSGLVIEVLMGVGILPHGYDGTAHDLYLRFKHLKILPHGYDGTAHDLYLRFKHLKTETLKPGCLVFWFRDGRARHVEMALDEYHTLGASGGGRTTTTVAEAIRQDAFVKMRPITYRGPQYKIVDPFSDEGE